MDAHFINNEIQASNIVNEACTDSEFMMLIYSVIYSVEKGYKIEIFDDILHQKKYSIKNFIIRKQLVK